MIYFCYVEEETNFQQMYQWIDKCCHVHDIFPVIINPQKPQSTQFPPWRFPSFCSARNSPELKDMSWVYVDLNGDIELSHYHHPEDNAVYVVGSDSAGFDGHEIQGDRIFIPIGQQYAAIIAPMVMYDRNLYVSGRRL